MEPAPWGTALTSRRTVLGGLAAIGGLVVAPAAGLVGYLYADSGRSNVGTLSFRNRLRIPPVLEPTIDADGRRRFRLALGEGRTELLPGTTTATWGVNGPILGPTLRVRRGDRVAMDVSNHLPETTTLHWHGMHLPAVMDGGPHQPIHPGRTWQPSWTVQQRAATLWYHPHLHHATAAHVYRGIGGLVIVDDGDDDAASLPNHYGVDDIPLILQDRRIDDDGTLDLSDLAFGGLTITGLLGDKILVNGTYDPYVEVSTTLVRLRLLNGANARIFHVGFTDDRDFSLVATDAGARGTPLSLNRLMLSPGERAEIVVAFRPGEEVVLRGFPPPLGANFAYQRLAGGGDTHDLIKMIAAATLRPSAPLPARLGREVPVPVPTRPEPFRLEMGDFLLNDRTMDVARVDRVVRTGSVELWQIVNGQSIPHNFHVHGSAFHILDIDGSAPPEYLRGDKDTVYVRPGATVRLAVRFLDHSDIRWPYMFHCHLLAHEDAGMMGQFLTVSPQDAPLVPAGPGAVHDGHGN
ncbi:multicopper oxidase family protein [Micromonospora matsumotoense]|uniref:multicopper oxidase family protein n=1 Tax=Micromonospora matsumotoense TaxID=121616 RepID=UPI003D9387BA